MAVDRLGSLAAQVTDNLASYHPFDPLATTEIEAAVAIVRKEEGDLFINAVSLKEPAKKEMLARLANPSLPQPARTADVVAMAKGSKVYDGLVDLTASKIVHWELLDGFQPLVSS